MKQLLTLFQCVVAAEELVCCLSGMGKQGLETSEGSLAAGESVVASWSR